MARPLILGIVNITADSFSDGGHYLDPAAAIARALLLVQEGADIIDLGPAASNPDAEPVSPAQEIARLTPVVAALRPKGIPLSIDSFQPETQAFALSQGVHYLNDIQGFPEPAHYPRLAESTAKLIVMHSVQGRGQADKREVAPEEIMGRIFSFFDARLSALEGAGIARERLIIDPGMGFFLGTNPQTSLSVLRGLQALGQRYRLPVLVSVTRKSFLRQLVGASIASSGPVSLAAELFAATQGVAMIRTHDPRALRDGLTLWAAAGARIGP
ncbi:MAG: dihydropteroate synthase [Alphaproteobacteria bacterium]|nr:dihydropteroate synthase [Alphaproteobacteria bacterium]